MEKCQQVWHSFCISFQVTKKKKRKETIDVIALSQALSIILARYDTKVKRGNEFNCIVVNCRSTRQRKQKLIGHNFDLISSFVQKFLQRKNWCYVWHLQREIEKSLGLRL